MLLVIKSPARIVTVKTFFKLKTYQGFQFTAKTYRSDFVNIQREYGNSTETITDVTGHKTGEPRVYTHYMDTGTKIRLRISKSLLDRPYRKDHFSFNNCDARKLQIFSLFFNFVSSSVYLNLKISDRSLKKDNSNVLPPIFIVARLH